MKQKRSVPYFMISNLNVVSTIIITIALVCMFVSRNNQFLSLGNMFNLVQQNAALIVVAVGMTFVVISGNMDLSSGSLIVLTACITGIIYRETGNIWLALIACVLASTFIGMINGLLIAYLHINAVIITLSCMIWARGLALGITGASSIPISSKVLSAIYRPFAFEFVNITVCIVLFVLVLGWFLLTRTKFGRYTKALGESEKATDLAGINTKMIKWIIFTFAAFLTGIASVVDIARLGSAVTTIGANMEMNAIVAVVIGGNKLSGGEGSFSKTITGLMFMCVLSNGLSTLGVTDDKLYLIKGLMILGALAVQMVCNTYRIKYLKRFNEN